MMRTIKTSRGDVFVVAQKDHSYMRLQKNGSWWPIETLTVEICSAREQVITGRGADSKAARAFPGDVVSCGIAMRSEVEREHNDAKAMKLAFGRAVCRFSDNANDRKLLWKAFRKGL